MSMRTLLRAGCASVALLGMTANVVAFAENGPLVPAGASGTEGAKHYLDIANMAQLSYGAKVQLLRKKIKYVFVLFQENRSFDHYFGTYPGAEGLYTQPPSKTPGFTQAIRDTNGTYGTITPFLIPREIKDKNGKTVPLYPEDTASVDHSHKGMVNSMHFDADKLHAVAANDAYSLNEEGLGYDATGHVVTRYTGTPPTTNPTLPQKQMAELVVSHIDCDTIPFLWQYADRFTLFDNFRQTEIGPSTPNAIAMISGQSGETQWALHNSQAPIIPVLGDPGPFPGSNLDHAKVKPPYGPNDVSPATPTNNLTFASLPLSFMGQNIETVIKADQNPAADLLDVSNDIKTIAAVNGAVNWAWYQQGFDKEPFDSASMPIHASYITHHNGPQYFGYIGDNTSLLANNLKGLGDFYTAVSAKALPKSGGVFYVRGGYFNNQKLETLDPNPTVRADFPGNDDHPGYSDAQISEANIADSVNAIASSPYWPESAIIITYDETDGLWDHVRPRIRTLDPTGLPEAGGPRIPAIVISPYGVAHAISRQYSEHSSVIKFINDLFNLVPLAELPDELNARKLGLQNLKQPHLGPADALISNIGDLFEAFDNNRLLGIDGVLSKDYATIDPALATKLPQYNGAGCKALNITPTDYVNGTLIDPPPHDFNPRPSATPGIPYDGNWTP